MQLEHLENLIPLVPIMIGLAVYAAGDAWARAAAMREARAASNAARRADDRAPASLAAAGPRDRIRAEMAVPRDEMREPSLILARMAEDIAERAARSGSTCILDMVEIGWPLDVAKAHWRAAASRADSTRIEAAARAAFAGDERPSDRGPRRFPRMPLPDDRRESIHPSLSGARVAFAALVIALLSTLALWAASR